MISRRLWVAMTATVWWPTALAAQESRDTVEIEPIVVTATRLPTPRSAVTATVTVLDGAALRDRGVSRVLDALRAVPGLNVVQSGSYGSNTAVLMRGGESDYVKVLIDGVPLNDPGGAFDFANLTLDNVERIEIVRGPTSVLYGSDGAAGVIEIFTRNASGPPRGELGFRAGTFSAWTVDGGVTGGTERVSATLGVSRSTTEGLYAFNNRYDHLELSGMLRVQPDEQTNASIMVRYSDSDFHYPTDGSGNAVDRNARQLQDRLVGSVMLSRFLADRVEGKVQFAFNETDGGIDDRSDGPADTLGFYGFQSSQTIRRHSLDAHANVYLPSSTVVTVGASVERQSERGQNQSQSQFGPSSASTDVARTSDAYYVQVQSRPVDRAAVNAGVRLDDQTAFGSFWTYRLGASYAFASATRVRASAGKAFKEPTFFESFSETPFAIGNAALDPERSTSWEVGVEQRLAAGRVVVGVTYFDQEFRDLIQYTATPPDPAGPNYFNVAKARASGVEFEGRIAVGTLAFSGNYTYLDTEVTDAGLDVGPGAAFVAGESLLRRPTHTATVTGHYRIRNRARVGVDVYHVGARDDRDFSSFPAGAVVLPSYTRIDVVAAYTVRTRAGRLPGLEVRGRVENVFDATYHEVFGFPARTRTVLVGGRVLF